MPPIATRGRPRPAVAASSEGIGAARAGLGGRSVEGAERDVAGAGACGGARPGRVVVARDADQRVRSEQRTRPLERGVVLAEVHAGRAHLERELGSSFTISGTSCWAQHATSSRACARLNSRSRDLSRYCTATAPPASAAATIASRRALSGLLARDQVQPAAQADGRMGRHRTVKHAPL
jgi:hypothetical protein